MITVYFCAKGFTLKLLVHLLKNYFPATFGLFLPKKSNQTNVFCLGDSHAAVFANREFKTNFSNHNFFVISIGGATASGLENPNSVTNTFKIFDFFHRYITHDDIAIFQLGEVDTGFVIWWRSQKYQESVDLMLDQAVENYCKWIEKFMCRTQVCVVSCPLPTINENDEAGDIAKLRSAIRVPQVDRTKLALEFNSRIRKFCIQNDVSFISLDDESMNSSTGLVKTELLNSDKNDHHYEMTVYARIVSTAVKSVICDLDS